MPIVFWILSRAPLRVAWGFSWACAWLWWSVAPFRRKVAIDNFRRAFPDNDPGRDLRRMFAGLVMGYFELFREMRVPGSIVLDFAGQERLQAEVAAGEGSFLLSGHFGSWDLVGAMVCRDLPLPADVIVKTPKHPGTANLIEQVRRAFNMGLLPVRNVMKQVYAQVDAGRVVVFMLDQRLNRGIPVPFFGAPALTSPALAHAAFKSGRPVHTLWFSRVGVGHHRLEFGPPIEMSGDVDTDSARFSKYYEGRIRQLPHNWLWVHDRWRR